MEPRTRMQVTSKLHMVMPRQLLFRTAGRCVRSDISWSCSICSAAAVKRHSAILHTCVWCLTFAIHSHVAWIFMKPGSQNDIHACWPKHPSNIHNILIISKWSNVTLIVIILKRITTNFIRNQIQRPFSLLRCVCESSVKHSDASLRFLMQTPTWQTEHAMSYLFEMQLSKR